MLPHPLHLIQLLPMNTLPHKFSMLIANNKTSTKSLFGWSEKWEDENRGENMKENNLWGCLVMVKTRRDLVGPMHFLFVLSKKYLQIGVTLGEKMAERRGVDDKLLNVPFPSLCHCCVLGSVHFPFSFFFQRVFFRF